MVKDLYKVSLSVTKIGKKWHCGTVPCGLRLVQRHFVTARGNEGQTRKQHMSTWLFFFFAWLTLKMEACGHSTGKWWQMATINISMSVRLVFLLHKVQLLYQAVKWVAGLRRFENKNLFCFINWFIYDFVWVIFSVGVSFLWVEQLVWARDPVR